MISIETGGIARAAMSDSAEREWSPDKRINWAICLLVVALMNWLTVFLMSLGVARLPHGGLFWVGTGMGLLIALILNCCRPRYDKAGRFWKPVYTFLLVQMRPPD